MKKNLEKVLYAEVKICLLEIMLDDKLIRVDIYQYLYRNFIKAVKLYRRLLKNFKNIDRLFNLVDPSERSLNIFV